MAASTKRTPRLIRLIQMGAALAMMASPVLIVWGQSEYTSDITQVLMVPQLSDGMRLGMRLGIFGFLAFVAARFLGWFWEP